MPSRIVREELLESDRWLGLAHASERLAFVVLLLQADDLGCLELTDGSLVRRWRDPCQVKGREDAAKILAALVDADLVRVYEDGGKRYGFIPRFGQRFRARTMKHPAPPVGIMSDQREVSENIKEIQARSVGNASTSLTGVSASLTDDGLGVGECVVECVGGVQGSPALLPTQGLAHAKATKPRSRRQVGPKEIGSWLPDASFEEWAERNGFSREVRQRAFQTMKAWALSKGARRKDWKATLQTFLLRDRQRGAA